MRNLKPKEMLLLSEMLLWLVLLLLLLLLLLLCWKHFVANGTYPKNGNLPQQRRDGSNG